MKRTLGGLAAAALCLSGLVALAPASLASTTVAIDCTQDVTIYGAPGDTFVFDLAAVSCEDWGNAGYYYFANTPDVAYSVDGWLKNVSANLTNGWTFARLQAPSTATSVTTQLLATNTSSSALTVGAQIALMDGPTPHYVIYGGTSAPSNGGSTQAAIETLSLATSSSGATCTVPSLSGVTGAWVTVPSADQCTQSGPTAKAGAVLLGWSTSASFPIARAQSQVDKKWGAIDETIDGIRMIFIPAGMPTFVSGSNNLFPIWSK